MEEIKEYFNKLQIENAEKEFEKLDKVISILSIFITDNTLGIAETVALLHYIDNPLDVIDMSKVFNAKVDTLYSRANTAIKKLIVVDREKYEEQRRNFIEEILLSLKS